jgi:hypothetical protein
LLLATVLPTVETTVLDIAPVAGRSLVEIVDDDREPIVPLDPVIVDALTSPKVAVVPVTDCTDNDPI